MHLDQQEMGDLLDDPQPTEFSLCGLCVLGGSKQKSASIVGCSSHFVDASLNYEVVTLE